MYRVLKDKRLEIKFEFERPSWVFTSLIYCPGLLKCIVPLQLAG